MDLSLPSHPSEGPAPGPATGREDLAGLTEDELRRRLLSQPLIDQAKGVLMGRYRCDADAAFAILRRWSMSRQVKLRLLAAEIIDVAQRSGAALDDFLKNLNVGP